MQARKMQAQQARAAVVAQLQQHYAGDAAQMYNNVQRIARECKYIAQYEMMLHDDDAEELVREALLV